MKNMVPRWPISDSKEEEAVIRVLRSDNWWRNAGTETKAFEHEFAEYQDTKGGIAVSNGTVAIEIALKALGIGENDEVIVPDFTFYSTVSAVLAVKAIPVLVDVLSDTYCIDPKQIERAITSKTKAIIPVHIAGVISNMDEINAIAKKHNLYVIEDCSHAHGAVKSGKKAGSFGTISTFSFQNAKLMTAGEGGIILSTNEELMQRVLLEANCGRAENDTTYQHVLIGTNARLSELQGAVLRIQLQRLDEQLKLREKNYQYLCKKLNEIPGITMQEMSDDQSVHPHYMVMFYYDKTEFGNKSRADFVSYLKNNGIPSNHSYEAIQKLPIFTKLDQSAWRYIPSENKQCSNSERIANEVVCLAHNILLGDEQLIDEIIDTILEFKK